MEAFVIICLILVVSQLILSKFITGNTKVELPDNAKRYHLFGKIILSIIGIVALIGIMVMSGFEENVLKWFLMIIIIVNFGFQSVLNWKFLKDYKGYIVSFSILIIGIGLVNMLL